MKTVEELAQEAGILERFTPKGMEQWHADALYELSRFRDLVLEEAAYVCDPYTHGQWFARAIRAMKGQK
jgi:hypothetical protein